MQGRIKGQHRIHRSSRLFVPLTSVKKRGSEDVPVRDAQHRDKASGVHAESIAYLNDALAVHRYAR